MNIRDLREQLTDETIKDILGQFNVEPVEETESEIIFPTCDHNLEGGSPKLFYYKNTKLFRSYTDDEQKVFDIFSLLQKMMKLRGRDISLKQAIQMCDLNIDENITSLVEKDYSKSSADDIRYMQQLNSTYIPNIDELQFKVYNKDILRKFNFDYIGLMPWVQEGIGIESLQKFNIKYDSYRNAIVIPNFDYEGKLIGVRERFLKQEDILKGKYRPLYDNGVLYNHPTGRTFYGIYENNKNIERKKTVVIFEGKR